MMNNKGAVLPITLAFVLAFTLVGFSTIYMSTLQNEAAEKRIASEKAFWLAEAGVQKALWEFKNNNCRNFKSKSTGLMCAACATCGEKVFASADGDMDGHYNVEMSSANSVVTATGSYPNRTPGPNRTQRTVQLASRSQFDYGIVADQEIHLTNGTTVDSYNSSVGLYSDSNKSSNGDVGSNGTTNTAIRLMNYNNPHDVIKGDVSTGVGGVISGPGLNDEDINNAITGIISHENDVSLPAVEIPSNLKGLSQNPKLDVDRSVTISEGDYKYSSIGVKNGGKLTINGKVRIYLTSNSDALKVWGSSEVKINPNSSLTIYTDGHVSVHNGSNINNLTRDPKKLTIYSTVVGDQNGNEGVNIWNSSDFYGAIYAPGSHVSITNNGDVYGSFVGKDFSLWNSVRLHYDESLAGKITDSAVIWREIGTNVVP